MNPETRRLHANPTPLKIVAWISIAFGVLSLGKMAYSVSQGGCLLDLGVLGFAAAYGLRRHQNGWRIATLLFASFGIFINVVILLFVTTWLFTEVPNRGEDPLILPRLEQGPPGVRLDPDSPQQPPPGVIGHSEAGTPKVDQLRIPLINLEAKSMPLAWTLAMVSLLLLTYMMHVLLRPEIRDLFKVSRMNDRPLDDSQASLP